MNKKEIKEEIKNTILKKHQSKESSANLYAMNVMRLAKLLDTDPLNEKFAEDNEQEIDKIFKDSSLTARKNMVQGLVMYIKAQDTPERLIKKYQQVMADSNKEMSDIASKQEKTEKQSANWVPLPKLKKVIRDYEKELKKEGVLSGEGDLPKALRETLKKYVVGMLYLSGDDNPPLRLDYGNMKIISKGEYDKLKDGEKKGQNYLVIQGRNKKLFSLGNYKTAGTYGILEIPVGKALNKVLNIWLRYNKTGYLLANSLNNPLTPSQMTKLIQQTFAPTGKNISASMLRHIYLSTKFPAQNQEKAETAALMAHSTSTANTYSKKEE